MRKFLQALLISAFAMAAAGCVGPQGPKGDPGNDGGVNMFVDEFTVLGTIGNNPNGWQFTGDGNELMHERTFPALDNYVATYGAVLGYIWSNGLWFPMQNTQWHSAGSNRWEESFTFGYTNNTLVIYFKDSDFYYDQPPGNTDFRFVLMW